MRKLTRWLVAAFMMLISQVGFSSGQVKPVRVGMAKSFLAERPKAEIEIATGDFQTVMKKTTGLEGDVSTKDSAFEIADKLAKKQLDFAILHAHEFGWVQKNHPGLEPLLIAAGKHHIERGYIVVHQKNPAKSFADLNGKKFDMPTIATELCRLYVARLCRETAKKSPEEFFEKIQKSTSHTDALDEVARDRVQATIVDLAWLEFYKEVKGPVFAKNLRILTESEAFPPAVLVYQKGGIDEKTLKQLRDGLLKAHTVPQGREMMKSWNLDAFEPVPKDYAKSVADIVKIYPSPR